MAHTSMTSILAERGNVSYITSDNNTASIDIFANEVAEYNSDSGFLQIKNPGWIKIVLNEARDISYIRFLLWDNRGSAIKRQPSNRRYTYRLLVAEVSDNGAGGAMVWNAVYENSLNPSNGWQEFYFENGARKIKAIKIQFLQNTSASKRHNFATQLVSVQAYSEVTNAIAELLDKPHIGVQLAPKPTFGFVRNRVIIGSDEERYKSMVEEAIVKEIIEYIDSVCSDSEGCSYPDLDSFKADLERENGKNDIEKQIDIFNGAIFKPINLYNKKLGAQFSKYSTIASIIFICGIIKELVDMVCLYQDWQSPLTWDFLLRLFTGC